MFEVTPAVLATASNELGEISSEMKTIMGNMDRLVENLKQSWQDENGKTFISRFENEVSSQFSNYYNLVKEYSAFIKGAHDKYEASLANIKSSVSTYK